MDLNQAILYAQLVNAAYAVPPDNTNNAAGQTITAGGTQFDVVTSIFANDLSTDMNPEQGTERVSIGLVLQASGGGDVVIAIRGTEGIHEWIHDAQFLLVPCTFAQSSGSVEDGFNAMYLSMRVGTDNTSLTVTDFMKQQQLNRPITSVTVCGHSLGAALATLLTLDIAVNTPFFPSAYTYASPRTGDTQFVRNYNHLVPNTNRIANRLDVVPNLPFPPLYEHVQGEFPLNPAKVTLFPFSVTPLLKLDVVSLHILTSYLHLLGQLAGQDFPLDDKCEP
jgi:hypothetical protein